MKSKSLSKRLCFGLATSGLVERMKKMYDNTKNPNDRGICGNYAHVCCGERPDSLIQNMHEEITLEQYLRENVEPEKFEKLFYGEGRYGSMMHGMIIMINCVFVRIELYIFLLSMFMV